MSVLNVLMGAFGLLGLFLVLALAMTWAARGAGRLVGVAGFRWFDERPAQAAWWRWLVVRLASLVAPVGVSFVLFWSSMFVGGVPAADSSTRVEVLEGAARAGGMRDGDRILRIGGEPIADWDQLRAAVKRHTGATPIEVERAGQLLLLSVTPRNGRIGVTPPMKNEQLGVVATAARAIRMPFVVVRETAASLVREARGAESHELMGPVGIVRETSKAQQRSGVAFVLLLAVLAGYLWPFAAGLALFDVVTGYIFRASHPEAAASSLRGYRLERLRQASLFAAAGYTTFALAFLLLAAGVSYALALIFWAMLAAGAGYPLIWSAGKELWGRPASALVLVACIFVPCALLIAVLVLHDNLGRALKGEAFRVTWLNAQPPAISTEQSRWNT